jgi:hypothetical protein
MAEKPQRGRRPDVEGGRPKFFQLKISKADMEAIRRRATKEGISLSHYFRREVFGSNA